MVGQVRIKLGPEHPATLRLDHADAAYRALDMIRMEAPAITGTYAERQVAEFIREQRRRFQQNRGNFKIAQEQFVALAHSAAGAQLSIVNGPGFAKVPASSCAKRDMSNPQGRRSV